MENREELKRDIESIDFNIYSLVRNNSDTKKSQDYEEAILLLEEQKNLKKLEFQKKCREDMAVIFRKRKLYEELLQIAKERNEDEKSYADEISMLEDELADIQSDLEDLEILLQNAKENYEVETEKLTLENEEESSDRNWQEWQARKEALKQEIKGFEKAISFGHEMKVDMDSLEAVKEDWIEKLKNTCDRGMEIIFQKVNEQKENYEQMEILRREFEELQEEMADLGIDFAKIEDFKKQFEKQCEVHENVNLQEKEEEPTQLIRKEELIEKFQKVKPKLEKIAEVLKKVEDEMERRGVS